MIKETKTKRGSNKQLISFKMIRCNNDIKIDFLHYKCKSKIIGRNWAINFYEQCNHILENTKEIISYSLHENVRDNGRYYFTIETLKGDFLDKRHF